MKTHQFLDKLKRVKKQGSGWNAECVAHDDKHQSLSVSEGKTKIVIHCHAGCNTDLVLEKLGLSYADLIIDKEDRKYNPFKKIIATYDYTDEIGNLLYQAIRYEDKGFGFRRPTKNGGWKNNLEDCRRVPYNFPALFTWCQIIFIVEGEKDCNNLGQFGLVATTNSGGAGKWKFIEEEAARALKDKEIVIIPDNDKSGEDHAKDVAERLYGIAKTIRILILPGLPPKGDVSDWLNTGGTKELLIQLVQQCQFFVKEKVTIAATEESNDVGNLNRFVAMHKDKACYVESRKRWAVWSGDRWKIEELGIQRLIIEMVASIKREAEACNDDKQKKLLMSWYQKSSSLPVIERVERGARDLMKVDFEQFDSDPLLLNVRNGTINLRTGVLRHHSSSDMLTSIAPVDYDPSTKSEFWNKFIDRILPAYGLSNFMQRAVGYSLTGQTAEHVLFILHGSGANGKSTMIDTIRMMLGDYAKVTEQTTFLSKQYDTIRNDLAMLKGARFVCTAETSNERKFDESLVKACTGGDPITARFMRANFFTFMPQFKIFLSTNHKPKIVGMDDGIWRRIRLVPFNVTIPEEERNRGIMDAMRQELTGILTWAVRGCESWQKHGLVAPNEVLVATNEYKREMDQLSEWYQDHCSPTAGSYVPQSTMYGSYKDFTLSTSDKPIALKEFKSLMKTKGFSTEYKTVNSKKMMCFVDISLSQSNNRGQKGQLSLVNDFLNEKNVVKNNDGK